jgi:hypothetical protein
VALPDEHLQEDDVPTAFMAAQTGDYDAFASVYDPVRDDATALLFQALSNPDPASRAAIANRLLDDGADAAAIEARATTINTLLGQVRHDIALEAPLLQRLIEGGADVNHREERGLLPVRQAVKVGARGGDEGRRPLYEVLFAAPELDLALPSHPRKPEVSQRQQFDLPAWQTFPVLLEHVRRWDERHRD